MTSDGDFIRLFNQLGGDALARELGLSTRAVYARRKRLEGRYGIPVVGRGDPRGIHTHAAVHPGRIQTYIKNGIVLVGSDAHIWPGEMSMGLRAMIQFAKEMKPVAVVMNGDVCDFPQISRHPPIGHQNLPDVMDEINEAAGQLHVLELAVSRKCKLYWTLGNHDARFETKLATVAPEFKNLKGHALKHYFPAWEPSWSVWINDDVVVKHRFKGGLHATHNNTVTAGRTMVTGHLHSAKVTPWSDYNGTRWGVDTGCLADPQDRQFLDYTEDNPKNWRQGFGVLTFVNGRLLPPELVQVWDEKHVVFRGEMIKVTP